MIAVLGGVRFVGRFIVRELREAGEPVTWLVRDPEAAHPLAGPGVRVHECDLTSLPAHLPSADCVVCTAPIPMASLAVDACRRVGATRAVFLSSGWANSRFATPEVEAVREGEAVVRDSGLRWTIIRPTMIYGPGDRNVSVLRSQIERSPFLPVIGSGDRAVQPVYVEDLAFAVSSAVSRRSAENACFDVAGPEPMTYVAMLDAIANGLGRRPIRVHVPAWVAYLVASLSERFSDRPRLTQDRVRRLSEDRHADISAARDGLGFFPVPFAEGLARASTAE